jgi:hypothetical protein
VALVRFDVVEPLFRYALTDVHAETVRGTAREKISRLVDDFAFVPAFRLLMHELKFLPKVGLVFQVPFLAYSCVVLLCHAQTRVRYEYSITYFTRSPEKIYQLISVGILM